MAVAEKTAGKSAKKKAARKAKNFKSVPKAKPKSKDVSEETNVVFGELVELLVSKINRNPYNRHPRKSDIDELAKSIETHGQLEPCLVRMDKLGGYEMISGETRLLAHRFLKRKTIVCRVGRCDDATALKLVAAANGARKDLDAIQRAELLQQLCLPVDDGGSGMTQEEAGKLIAEDGKPMSRPAVSNAMRLLKLPGKLQLAIADGKLPETYAREIVPLFAIPAGAAIATPIVTEELDQVEGQSRFDWVDNIRWEIKDKTRSMSFAASPTSFDLANPLRSQCKCFFKPTNEQKEQLGIIKVGDESRATNKGLWSELQTAAAKKKLDGGSGGSQSGSSMSPVEKQKQRTSAIGTRVAAWKQMWMRWWLSHEVDDAEAVRFVLMHATSDPLFVDLLLSVKENESLSIKINGLDDWMLFRALQDAMSVNKLFRLLAAEALWPKDPESLLAVDRWLVDSLAEDLKFDECKAWHALLEADQERTVELLESFYEIFTKGELEDLVGSMKVKGPDIQAAKTKGELVKVLAETFITLPPVLKPDKKRK